MDVRSHFDCFYRMCNVRFIFAVGADAQCSMLNNSHLLLAPFRFHFIEFALQQRWEMKDKENEIVMRYATVHLNDFRNCDDVDDDKLIV